jgi:hydroxymethylpyrimidine/phosphomethylpyrimidine kinase
MESALEGRGQKAVLTIAGSDSSGGAGLQRDLRTLVDYKLAARFVVTSVTAQGKSGVTAQHHVPVPIILEQMRAAADEGCVAAIKIGMLGTQEIVEATALGLRMLPAIPVVLDPVLAASSGASLLSEDGQRALLQSLCPLVTLLTPNLEEAAQLLTRSQAKSAQEVIAQASALRDALGCAVLIKGGHAEDDHANDYLAVGGTVVCISGTRVHTQMRGTGCALSTAIAAELVHGGELEDACRKGKRYVESLLAARALPAKQH